LTFSFGYRSFIGTIAAKSGSVLRNFAAFVSLSSQATLFTRQRSLSRTWLAETLA
jgi:hypothetical protein